MDFNIVLLHIHFFFPFQVKASKRITDCRRSNGARAGRALLPFAWPILGADGRVDKGLVISLELSWFGERFARAGIRPAMVTLILDEEGRVVYGDPDREKLTGTLHADAPLFEAVRRTKADRVLEVPGLDGVPRIYAHSKPPSFSELGLTLAFGMSKAEVGADADRGMRRNLAVFALVDDTIFALAWWISEISLRRPLAKLGETFARLRAGPSLRTAALGATHR